ncbi:hypothetical protein BH10BAC2_BH10BAC2_06440 [soil metagenome]
MRHLKILLFIFFLFGILKVNAAETEPNNTKATANTLALNGNNTGAIKTAGDIDWWKVTTNADGRLDITLTPLSNKYTWIYLYDNDGSTLLNSKYSTSTFTLSQDGLAAGTYYIKINTYYGNDTSSYALSNLLVQPADANDAEPNDTKAQAKVLPLGGNRTGHVGYYYNNYRDTADWWKVTTNADGQLNLTLTPGNGEYVWIYLYDNDGTTLLGSTYSTSAFTLSKDGLAAGIYYVRIKCYYNSKFAPYKLSNTLTQPAQTNDAEPNNTKAQAIDLGVDSTVKGHIGYYYNNTRDTFDWYKLSIPEDGMIALTLTPANGEYVWAYLYDNNGTSLLNSSYSTSAFTLNTDGLAAGTYYVRINCYYNSRFAPYTLTDSLKKYTNITDLEPNNRAYQAKTLLANKDNPGHIGFYYNNQRDTFDWHKINYTGVQNGAMTVTLTFEKPFISGYQYTYMSIYKDTNAAPLYNTYTSSGLLTANLSNLSQGYYWVRVRCYYSSDFQPYNIKPVFTQTKAAIAIRDSVISTACDNNNSITFRCTKSKAPYTVQLYRYKQPYRAVRIVNNNANFTFTGLPAGVYYATAFGDGATGNAFGKTRDITIIPKPVNPRTTAISSVQGRLNWDAVTCAKYFSIQFRKTTDAAWTTRSTNGNTTFYVLKNLSAATTYLWRVASADSSNNVTGTGAYTDSISFTTAATFAIAAAEDDAVSKVIAGNPILSVYPNPVNTSFSIQLSNVNTSTRVVATLRNMNNTIVWSKSNTTVAALAGSKVEVPNLANGMYMLQVTDMENNIKVFTKVIVAR